MHNVVKNVVTPPQTEPLVGRENEMLQGYSGGYRFKGSALENLERWLFLGNVGRTYYASKEQLNYDVLADVFRDPLVVHHPKVAVDLLVAYRNAVPRPKNVVGAYALLSVVSPFPGIYREFGNIVRNGADLLYFMKIRKAAGGGVGAGLRNAIKHYYATKGGTGLAYDMVKYKRRWGDWTQRDVLRLVHPKPSEFAPSVAAALAYGAGKMNDGDRVLLSGSAVVFEDVVRAAQSATEVAEAVRNCKAVVWEAIPTRFLKDKQVWSALLDRGAVGARALLRNVRRFFENDFFEGEEFVSKFTDQLNSKLESTPISPMLIYLAAYAAYAYKGHPGSDAVFRILSELFDKSFDHAAPLLAAGTYAVAVDDSASMEWSEGANPSPFIRALGMAYILSKQAGAGVTINHYFVNTATRYDSKLFKGKGLYDVFRMQARGGGTYLNHFPALLMQLRGKHTENLRGIVMISDNETYGDQHYSEVVKELRRKLNLRDLPSVTIGVSSYPGTLADPEEERDLSVVGFDPSIIDVVSWHMRKYGQDK